MKTALIQSALHWENREANLNMFAEKIAALPAGIDLIVLPEMFTTGFSMQPELYAEKKEGAALNWMLNQAKHAQSVVCGSVMFDNERKFTNRFFWVQPDGAIKYYDKRHLFRMGNEHLHYHFGNERLLLNYSGLTIFPVICYDIRFPVWLRRKPDFDYDVLLVVANWPERRASHWKALLQARAIENQCYVIAVNRVGNDAHGVSHSGDSCVYNPKGELISEVSQTETTLIAELDKNEVDQWRNLFPAINDADSFVIVP